MEVIVLLKFEVDSEQPDQEDDDVKAVTRHYTAVIVNKGIAQDKNIVLRGSALLSDVGDDTFQIIPSRKVIEKPKPNIKIK